jgi:hypothetical protein
MTPDSSKSTTDKLSEGFTDTSDKVRRDVQSDSSKSTTQSIGDKLSREKDDKVHGGTDESFLDKTKHTLGMDKQ